jgi:SAM-dependent methyltransferase
LEPDPKSAVVAQAKGVPVHACALEPGLLPDNHYDAITLCHVIEHLHDPVETLQLCWPALKPGGIISVITPNLASCGHQIFQASWLPLDPPRHLVLFTPRSLRVAVARAGFEPEASLRRSLNARSLFVRSALIQRGGDPMKRQVRLGLWTRLWVQWLARAADRATLRNPERTEELVLCARKPAF